MIAEKIKAFAGAANEPEGLIQKEIKVAKQRKSWDFRDLLAFLLPEIRPHSNDGRC